MLDNGVDWAALARGDGDPGVLAGPLGSSAPEVRSAAVEVLVARCRAARSAPAVLVPMLESLVRDPGARDEAVVTLRRCGRASARYADFLAEAAGGAPNPVTRRRAVETLMQIGDPRWVGPLVREGAALLPHTLMPLPCPPDVLDAVRRALPANAVLSEIVARWGTDAAEAAPELLEALPHAPQAATRALLAIGHLAAPMVPELRSAASRPGGLLAATALFRLTGDPAPALRALLTARPPVPPGVVALLGPLARSLVSEFELLLTGAAAETPPQCAAQLLAAQVVIAATGDTTAALPTLHAILTVGGHRAAMAAAVVADLAEHGYGAPESPAPVRPASERAGSGRASEDPGSGRPMSERAMSERAGSGRAVSAGPGQGRAVSAGPGQGRAVSAGPGSGRGRGGGGWRGEMAVWRPELRALLADPLAGVAAAGVLWRLGEPADGLVPVVVRAIEEGRRTAAAVTLLHELGAQAEAARLAGSDTRLAIGSAEEDIVITDELLRDRLRATAAAG